MQSIIANPIVLDLGPSLGFVLGLAHRLGLVLRFYAQVYLSCNGTLGTLWGPLRWGPGIKGEGLRGR